MNTLTQQQINQYQWQVAHGVARIVNLYDTDFTAGLHDKFELWFKENSFSTNAPDGIYSGEAFAVIWQSYYEGAWERITSDTRMLSVNESTRLFLRLKPSHLPAVLTTQPGKEWKDRYTCFIKQGNVEKECRTTNATFLKDKSLLWRLNDVTPPAEQEASKKSLAVQACAYIREHHTGQFDGECDYIGTIDTVAHLMKGFVESTLTPKDQRIAELERMLDQCQKNDLYFEQEKEQLNNRIAELEREREWVSVHEFDESTLPIVGKSVIGIVDYMRCGIDKRDYIVCYMGEEKETRLLADDDYYGWDFDECIAQWVYLDMPLKPIF